MSHERDVIERHLAESAATKRRLAEAQADAIAAAGQLVTEALRRGRKLLLAGNGGSAADAQHIAAEFVGRFRRERRSLPAIALTTDTSAITAIGNDYGFEQIFARQVLGLGEPGDVLVAISTSGNSPNILRAVEAAAGRGMRVIGLMGGEGGVLKGRCDVAIVVPSTVVAHIQESHITCLHAICELADATLSGPAGPRPVAPAARKVVTLAEARAWRERLREAGKTVVWTNGCFDLLHVGHIASLEAARALGDALVVGINSDDSVRGLKGPGRPLVPAPERARVLAALEVVDRVVVFDALTPEAALDALRPDVHTKGADYAPPHGKPVPEQRMVEAYGGRIAFLPLVEGWSTTDLAARIGAGPSR